MPLFSSIDQNTNIGPLMILGMPFLRSNKATLKFATNTIELPAPALHV